MFGRPFVLCSSHLFENVNSCAHFLVVDQSSLNAWRFYCHNIKSDTDQDI